MLNSRITILELEYNFELKKNILRRRLKNILLLDSKIHCLTQEYF